MQVLKRYGNLENNKLFSIHENFDFLSDRFYKIFVWIIVGFVAIVIIGVVLGLIPLYTSSITHQHQLAKPTITTTTITTVKKSYYIGRALIFSITNQTIADELIRTEKAHLSTKNNLKFRSDFHNSIALQVTTYLNVLANK